MKTAFRALVCIGLFLLLTAGWSFANETVYIQAKVFIDQKSDWVQIKGLGLDIVVRGDSYLEIITNAKELEHIKELGIRTEIVYENVSEFLRSRLPGKAMGAYRSLSEIYSYIDSIIAANPTIISSKIKIGETHEGRDMWAFKISDNPNIDEDEPEIMYTSAIHAREVITPLVLIYFINHIANNYGTDPEVTDIVDNRELWFVLVVNPDGYYHNEVTDPGGGGMWRKNRRPNGDGTFGVDLNRNYAYEWGYDDVGSSPTTSSETYRGTGPFSENETQAMRDFAIAHDFIISVYYHSYSNLILWSWGYDQLSTPDNDIFEAMGDSMVTWNNYAPGPAWTLYVANGVTDDWYYGEQTLKPKTLAMTFEVGSASDNFWPPASRINALISENLGPNLYMAKIAGHAYKLKAPVAPVLTVQDTVTADYTVYWSHSDSINPAVEYELLELDGYNIFTNRGGNFSGLTYNGFTISTTRYNSASSSFYSGSGNNLSRYFQTSEKYTVQAGDSIKLSAWYDIESDWDYAYVEVSTDGSIFNTIPGTITTNSDPHGNNRGNGITSTSSNWVYAAFDLGSYVGMEINIRFSYYTDSYTSEEGIYIDDFYPHVDLIGPVTYSSITDTSYSFTGKAADDYYYKVRARDAEDQWGEYSSIKMTLVIPNILCGDANNDGVINVGDAVFLINYVFKGGEAPVSDNAADANGDGTVNVADAVYLINFAFKGGPDPICD
ncbi:MAG: immune inhibitor A [candidate division Zixibacteria bacterium]|nr:immune inhibitor A [candidate division Zixibacteria bacterium]